MQHKAISTDNAPQAIGPYSQAIVAGGWVYVSGQIPLDPTSGEMVEGDIRAQAQRVMRNVGGVLEAAGAGFRHVVKAQIFLADLGDFAAVNEIYGSFFEGQTPPARACVQVAALPRGARVEIDAVAYLG